MAELEVAAVPWPISCHLDQSMLTTIMEGLEHGLSQLLSMLSTDSREHGPFVLAVD